jgi:hypothetical protein
MSLFIRLDGWQVAGTSFKMIFDVKARPPRALSSPEGFSNLKLLSRVLILRIPGIFFSFFLK